MLEITVESHPLLEAAVFTTELEEPLSALPLRPGLTALLASSAEAPFSTDDATRAAVRDLLRHGGYKPTGRGKPASEYLARAQAEGTLRPINPLVDACNVVSLHSGLPISVVDLDLARAPHHVAVAPGGTSYVFNASGQSIDVSGLLCLFDAEGACANAVKDSQRTKTHAGTRHTLSVLWGTRELAGLAARAAEWYRTLLAEHFGATTREVAQRK